MYRRSLGIRQLLLLIPLFIVPLSAASQEDEQEPGRLENGKPPLREIRVATLIAPRSESIDISQIFIAQGTVVEETGGGSKDRRAQLFRRKEIGTGATPFGMRAAYIPFWQMSQLYRKLYPRSIYGSTSGTALLGDGAFYLPPSMSPRQRTLSLALLRFLRSELGSSDERVAVTGERRGSGLEERELRIEIELGSLSGSLSMLADDEPLRFERLPSSSSMQRFALYAEGEHPQTVISPDITYYRAAYVATRDLKRGTYLEPLHVQLTALPAGRRKENGFSPEKLKSGYRFLLREDIEAGARLRSSALDMVPPIEGGDTVTCIFRNGRIRLSMAGRALSSGGIGEKVSVRLESGRRREMWVRERGVLSNRPVSAGKEL